MKHLKIKQTLSATIRLDRNYLAKLMYLAISLKSSSSSPAAVLCAIKTSIFKT